MAADLGERVGLLEALAVVGHAHLQLAIVQGELNPNFFRVGMLDGIGDGFLRDAQQVLLHFFGQLAALPFDVDVNLDGRTGGPLAGGLRKRSRKILAFER